MFPILALSLLLLTFAEGQLIQQLWTSSAFAPQSASVTTQVVDVNFTSMSTFPSLCSVRFSGTIVDTAATELVTFSAVSDGGVRLWIDDHLVIDAAGGNKSKSDGSIPVHHDSFLNVPFTAGIARTFRLEYSRWGSEGPATLQFLWSGNTTLAAIVPASAFSPNVSNFLVQRDALRDRLEVPAVPWQTYSMDSMGAHCMMPSGFALKAAIGVVGGVTLENIIPWRMGDPALVRPGLRSINGSDYTLLTISNWALAPNATVTFETTVISGDLIFLATCTGDGCLNLLLIVSPFMMAERAGNFSLDSSGNILHADLPGFPSVTTTGLGTPALPVACPGADAQLCFSLSLSNGPAGYWTGVSTPPTINTAQAAIAVGAAAALAAEVIYGDLAPLWEGMNSALGWNTIYTPYESVITPVSHVMGNIWGIGFILFEWDTYFFSLLASLQAGIARDIAYSNLIQVTLGRTLAGFVPNVAGGPRRSNDRSEDQVGALILKTIFDKTGDKWLLDGLLPVMLSWNDWVWERRRGEGVFAGADGYADLMCLGSDPNVPRSDTQDNMQAARYEGMDNSPIYDSPNASFNFTTHHMDLYDVGATACFASDTEATIALCAVVTGGCPDRLPSLSDRLTRVQAAMNTYMWDDSTGMYTNILFNGSKIEHFAPTSIFPLISGTASDAQAVAIVATMTSPSGFCYNVSHTPAPDSDMLVQWSSKDGRFSSCVSVECTKDVIGERSKAVRVEAITLLVAGGPAPGLIALNLFASATGASALVAGPFNDSAFTLVRQEGWCYEAPPSLPNGGWPTTPLTLWQNAAISEYITCGTTACENATGAAFVLVRTMCYAFNGTGPDNAPCKVGGPSIVRSDAAFLDNNYWRGRTWAPHHMLMYFALARYDHVPAARAARLDLVTMGAQLQRFNWDNFGVICENVNGLLGTCEDSGDADPFYHWGALFGFTTFVENGIY
jgi:hypothetical protein